MKPTLKIKIIIQLIFLLIYYLLFLLILIEQKKKKVRKNNWFYWVPQWIIAFLFLFYTDELLFIINFNSIPTNF